MILKFHFRYVAYHIAMVKRNRKFTPYSSSRVTNRKLQHLSALDDEEPRVDSLPSAYGNIFELPDEEREHEYISKRLDGSGSGPSNSRNPRKESPELDEEHLQICDPDGVIAFDEDEEIDSNYASSGEESVMDTHIRAVSKNEAHRVIP